MVTYSFGQELRFFRREDIGRLLLEWSFKTFVTQVRLQPFFLAISAWFEYWPESKPLCHSSANSIRFVLFSSRVIGYRFAGSHIDNSGHKKWEASLMMTPISWEDFFCGISRNTLILFLWYSYTLVFLFFIKFIVKTASLLFLLVIRHTRGGDRDSNLWLSG